MSLYHKEAFLNEVGLSELSPLQSEFWNRALQETGLDPKTNARSAILDFREIPHQGLFPTQLNRISILEVPKKGSELSADVAFLRRLSSGALFFFVGDGVKYMDQPPEQIKDILVKFRCTDRPDALLGKILRDFRFGNEIMELTERNSFDKNYIPIVFFSVFNRLLTRFYEKYGLSTNELKRSQLPSISGAAGVVDSDSIILSAIGDPVVNYEDQTRYSQNLLPRENMGIDDLTRRFVNEMVARGEVVNVSDALESDKFRRWIIHTFNEKINEVVSLVNGKDFKPSRVVTSIIPTSWVSRLRVGSDGLTLGLKELEQVSLEEFSKMSGSCESLFNYARIRSARQAEGFSERECKQDKKYDDVVGIDFDFRGEFSIDEMAFKFYQQETTEYFL